MDSIDRAIEKNKHITQNPVILNKNWDYFFNEIKQKS